MKLPAKIEYACKAVLELSIRYDGVQPLSLDKIAKPDRIPKKFLVQILQRLKDAGIVESSRGAAGGYFLTCHPAKITIADVVRALDRKIMDEPDYNKKIESINARGLIFRVWDEANTKFSKHLDVSFEELSGQFQSEQLTYQI